MKYKKTVLILFILSISIYFYGQENSGKIKLSNHISVSWTIKKFDKSKHNYDYCENSGSKYLCKIDGKKWYGSDCGMELPKNELTKLTLEINGDKIELNTNQMFNPNYSGTLNESQFKLKKTGNTYMLYAFFSDGAGTYTAYWKINNKKSVRIKISNDEKDFEWQLTK
jgi:hypothetical protein